MPFFGSKQAYDPGVMGPVGPARNASVTIHELNDTTAGLSVQDMAGAVISTVNTDQYGVAASFRTPDGVYRVAWNSGPYWGIWNSDDPITPTGVAVDPDGRLRFDFPDGRSVVGPVLPQGRAGADGVMSPAQVAAEMQSLTSPLGQYIAARDKTRELEEIAAPVDRAYLGGRSVPAGNDARYSAFPSAVRMPDGSIHLYYREGTDHANTRDGIIRRQVSTDMGVTWSSPVTVLSDGTDLRDPSVTLAGDGTRMWMVYFRGTNAAPAQGCYLRVSTDLGQTWGAESRIDPAQPYAAITAPLVEWKGKLWAAWYGKPTTGDTYDSVYVASSSDRGVSWSVPVRVVNGANLALNCQEPWLTVVQDRLVCTYRHGGDTVPSAMIGSIRSSDGVAWSTPVGQFLGSGRASTVATTAGDLLVTYRDYNWQNAYVRTSPDAGVTWNPPLLLGRGSWMYSHPLEITSGLVMIPTDWETSTTVSRLSVAYAMLGPVTTPFGDVRPDRRVATDRGADSIVIWDDFHRPDGTTLGLTPSRAAWTSSGGVAIQDGVVTTTTAAINLHRVSAGIPNYDVEADLQWATNAGTGIVVRYQDANNYLLCTVETNGTKARIYEIVAGVATAVSDGAATETNVTVPSGAWVTYRVVVLGDNLRFFLDGQLVRNVTTSRFASSRPCGFKTDGTNGATHRCRRFVIRSK